MIIQYIVIFVLIPGSLLDSMCLKNQLDKNRKLITVWSCCVGYQKVAGKLRCEPICREFCGNGTCVSPDVCQCDKGYQNLSNESNKSCVPKCSGGCANGTCVAPDVCKCEPGYEFLNSTGHCFPICTGCENGHCVVPGECICNSGYEKVLSLDDFSGTGYSGKCVPVCESECAANRTCVAPNQCNCTGGLIEVNDECVLAITKVSTDITKLSNYWKVTVTIFIICFVLSILGAILFNISRYREKYQVSDRRNESTITEPV